MQTTQTPPVVATSSWREKIIDEHRDLDQTVARIRQTLVHPRPKIGQPGAHAWASDVSRQVVELHDQLCRHFRYEEHSGMMEELVERHPRASVQVDTLRDEHVRMLEESRQLIAALLSYSEDEAASGKGLRQQMTSMLDNLEEHERRENSLIMDLAFSDLGLGD